MAKFTDTISIRIKAGNGGKGSVSFHREKFIPRGGPDGGDGGKGGDVYIEADIRLHNLSHLFKDRIYKAGHGGQGMGLIGLHLVSSRDSGRELKQVAHPCQVDVIPKAGAPLLHWPRRSAAGRRPLLFSTP